MVGRGRGHGQVDFDEKSGPLIVGPHGPMVQFDGAAGDGESQPNASAGAAAVLFHTIKRVENVGQSFVRDARAKIANGQPVRQTSPLEAHVNVPSFRRVADGIANNVLDSATQQLGIALHLGVAKIEVERDVVALGFDVNIVDNYPYQFVQTKGFSAQAGRIAFRARYLDQFTDEHVEPIRFAFDAIEGHVGIGAATRQLDSDAEARQG